MKKSVFAVKFSKFFVNGSLEGLMIDSVLTFATLEQACEYVNFCHSHKETPVSSVGGGDYTIHMARIETVRAKSRKAHQFLKTGRF
jgi:hypothetical protein